MARAEAAGSPARSWLPPNAIADRLPIAALDALVGHWSTDWFPADGARVGPWAPARAAGETLVLTVDPTRIADAMLGEVPVPPDAADRATLDAAANACVEDLRRRLVDLFGVAPPSDRVEGRHACGIDLPGTAGTLTLSVSDTLLSAWIRASLPPAPCRASVQPLSRALDAQLIGLSALVGHCRLTLRDLENWAVGDVLVLDRPLDAALDLVVGGRLCADASCRLVDAGDELHLVLC